MRTKTVLCLLGLTFSASAQRFVRFIATDGKTYTGDAILPPNDTDAAHSKQAKVITGDILGDFTITNQVKVGPERCLICIRFDCCSCRLSRRCFHRSTLKRPARYAFIWLIGVE